MTYKKHAEQVKGKNKETLVWLSKVAGKRIGYIVILLVLQMLIGISSVADAMALKGMIDAAVAKSGEKFFFWLAILVTLMGARIGFQALNRYLSEYSRAAWENCLKRRLMSYLLYQEYADTAAVHSAEWMNRLTSDTVIVANGMTEIIPGVTGMAVRLAGAIAMLLILYPVFCWLVLPGGIVLIVLTYIFRKRLKQLNKNIREADGTLRITLQEGLSEMLIVRAFAKEDVMLRKTEAKMDAHKNTRMAKTKFSNLCNIGFACIMDGAYVVGAGVCGYGILTRTMSYGTLMAVVQLVGQVQSPFANITGYLPRYYAMLASAERLMEIEQSNLMHSAKSIQEIQQFYQRSFQSIVLRNATFSYQASDMGKNKTDRTPYVLDGFDLTIQKGEYVALTGDSGCGKSTLLKVIMCLYPLDKGERVMKTDNEEIALSAQWRRLFAYVPQGNHLMSGTIREVITFGDEEGMNEEQSIFEALSIACAKEFVMKLPLGIDTVLGEHGSGLSEGQMQRIAIARALFSQSPILILDESTSALDEATEKNLLTNLQKMTDKTVLIVTHRAAARDSSSTIVSMIQK